MALYIHDYIAPDRVIVLDAADKTRAIDQLVDAVGRSGPVGDLAGFRQAVHDREKTVSTGIGLGVAVPHAKVPSVNEFFVALGLSKTGVEWDAIDQKPVRLVFLIGGPDRDQQTYLQILSKIVLVTKSPKLRSALLEAGSAEDALDVLASV